VKELLLIVPSNAFDAVFFAPLLRRYEGRLFRISKGLMVNPSKLFFVFPCWVLAVSRSACICTANKHILANPREFLDSVFLRVSVPPW
jgi:hypothetical protein